MEELWDMKWRGEDAAAAECLFHSSFQRGERRKRSCGEEKKEEEMKSDLKPKVESNTVLNKEASLTSPRSLVAQRVSGLDL